MNAKGASLIETAVASLLSVVIVLAVGTIVLRSQRQITVEQTRVEIQQKGRAGMGLLSGYLRSAGSNRQNVFSTAPYSTSSVLPIPRADVSLIRLQSDYNDDGDLGDSGENVLISWNSATKLLTIGSTSLDGITNFQIRYYNSSGTELVPPSGGWDISADASHGSTLASITRVLVRIELEGRYSDPVSKQLETLTITSDVAVPNQFTNL
jgi:hypothetical protein